MKKRKDDAIIAKGEATGHAHRMQGATVWEDDGVITFEPMDGATPEIVHEEHHRIAFPPGVEMETGQVQEYDHAAEEAKAVRD